MAHFGVRKLCFRFCDLYVFAQTNLSGCHALYLFSAVELFPASDNFITSTCPFE